MLGNQTEITEFILLGFGELYEMQAVLFMTFLVIYVVIITGNILIFAVVILDQHLHTPMYFFLVNLSFLESCYVSDLFPRMLLALLTGDRRISFSHCFMQWYLCSSFAVTECCLLCVMSYDRYFAICKPLHYATTMKTSTCICLEAAAWFNGFIVSLILLSLMLHLTYCGPSEMDHYFCEYFSLLKLACSDTSMLQIMVIIVAVIVTLPPFVLTVTSYVYIIAAILRIPSTTGRQKAFSTCSSHLIVVSIFYGSLMIVYMLPNGEVNRDMQKPLSLLYTVLTPLANPFIYNLRNKEVKDVLRKIFGRFVLCKARCIKGAFVYLKHIVFIVISSL